MSEEDQGIDRRSVLKKTALAGAGSGALVAGASGSAVATWCVKVKRDNTPVYDSLRGYCGNPDHLVDRLDAGHRGVMTGGNDACDFAYVDWNCQYNNGYWYCPQDSYVDQEHVYIYDC